MAEEKLTAATRLEKILDNIAGGDNEITPATRLEKFLSYIADAMEGGSGGGGDACQCKILKVYQEYDETTGEYWVSNLSYEELFVDPDTGLSTDPLRVDSVLILFESAVYVATTWYIDDRSGLFTALTEGEYLTLTISPNNNITVSGGIS